MAVAEQRCVLTAAQCHNAAAAAQGRQSQTFSAIAVISWIVLGHSDSAAEGRGTKRALEFVATDRRPGDGPLT